MNNVHRAWGLVFLIFAAGPAVAAQQLKPETEHACDRYGQAPEQRMSARRSLLLADADAALNRQVVSGREAAPGP